MSMQPTTAMPIAPAPRKSRRLWYIIGGVVVLLLATPTAFYFYAGWSGDREITELGRQIDEDDPTWRWPDLIAELKPPPDARNSAVQIIKVHGLVSNSRFATGGKWDNAPQQRNARWATVYTDPLREAFAGLPKGTVEEALKLKDMPEGVFEIQDEANVFAIRLEHLQRTRAVAGLLHLDAVLKSQDGDRDGAIESCMAILNTAESMKAQPFLIAQLIRMAEQAIALGALERTLGQGAASEASLVKMQMQMEGCIRDDGLHAAMRGERALGHQMYANVRSGKINLSEIIGGINGGKANFSERVVDVFPGVILNGYPEYLRMMNDMVRAAKLKDVERTDALAKLQTQVREKRRNLLIMLVMPATEKVALATDRVHANMRCAIVAVAAERYRLKNKDAWPRTLDDLVKAGLLKEVPTDPFDGKALRLKRTPTGLIIYSVGIDKVDNGGHIDRDNPHAVGSDLGFELFDLQHRGLPPVPEEERPNQGGPPP